MGFENITNVRGRCMMKDYKYYIDKYLDLLFQTCTKPEDYGKISIRKHNKAIVRLNALQEEICKDNDLAEKIFFELLRNHDITVLLNATACCIHFNLHIEEAVKTLEFIIISGDRWNAEWAERTLKIWRGEIGPDDPG